MTTVQRIFVPAGLALALLAGCGGGDESSDSPPPATTAAAEPATEAGRFEAEDVAFTFSYPADFQREDEDDEKQLAVLTPGPDDGRTGIRISYVSAQPLPFESYIDTFQKQFESDLGVNVAQRREEHGGYPMGVLEWADQHTYQDLGEEKTTELKSTSYFFIGGGKAWQIECFSDPERREQIETACAQILETIEPVA